MDNEFSWEPASGCFSCPIHAETGISWFPINPLPGFSSPNGGYYSIAFSSYYLPLHSCIDLLQYSAGEIAIDDLERFLAITAHEVRGHHSLNGSQRKQAIRLSIACAYNMLGGAMSNTSREEALAKWNALLDFNSAVKILTQSIALVEELFATTVGIESLKLHPLASPKKVMRTEDEFVSEHSKPNYFSKRFEELYKLTSRVYRKAGEIALWLAVHYAVGTVPLSTDGSPNLVTLLPVEQRGEQSNKFLSEYDERRLYSVLDILNWAPYSKDELHRWTWKEWENFFNTHLVGYGEEPKSNEQVHKMLKESYITCMQNQIPIRMDWSTIYQGNPEIEANPVATLLLLAEQNSTIIEVVPPGSRSLTLTINHNVYKALNENPALDTNRKLFNKLLTAQSKNRTLILVFNKNLQSTLGGIVITPSLLDTGKYVPLFNILGEWHYSSADPDDLVNDWMLNKAVAFTHMLALTFFEGLRQQVALGCGLRCPLKFGANCCGRSKALLRLWEVGKWAEAELGWSFKKWDKPTECLGDSV